LILAALLRGVVVVVEGSECDFGISCEFGLDKQRSKLGLTGKVPRELSVEFELIGMVAVVEGGRVVVDESGS
jgi:hypothetical protein